MNLPVDLSPNFEKSLQEIKHNYSYDYIKLTGFKPQNMSFVSYIKEFVESKNVNDISIDGTSNSDKKDIVALLSDIKKPILKLTAFNKIFTKLEEKYGFVDAKTWLEKECLGYSYLHDAHMASFIPYCYAYDLTKLANEGLFFISNNGGEPYNAEPAKHLDVFINLIKEYVSWCCNRQSGAVGLPNLIPYIYYFWLKDIENNYNGCHFIKKDGNDKYIGIEDYPKINNKNSNVIYLKQQIQAIIYALNQPFLRGGIQSAFTNVSIFDHEYTHALFDGVVFPDGKLALDHIENIITVEKIFMDVISEIRHKNGFTFPVLSYSILTETIDFDSNNKEEFKKHFKNSDYASLAENYCEKHNLKSFKKFKDEDFARWASDHNCDWLDSNFFIDDSITSLSNCCRLKSNISDLGYFNSIGGTALSVGSIKVNTLNFARIAYDTLTEVNASSEEQNDDNTDNILDAFFNKAEKLYLNKLKDQTIINLKCLDVIRDIIIKNISKGLLPNISDGLIDLSHMYNTVGFIGVYETLKAFQNHVDKIKAILGNNKSLDNFDFITVDSFGNHYYTKRAENFVKTIFTTLQDTFTEFKETYNIKYAINCEQIPGETAADKLKQKDTIAYANNPDMVINDLPVYGNQFIPLGIKTTIEERVRIAALFDSYCNGGSICHLNYESNFSDKQVAWEKLIWLAQQGLTYSAFTTKINACKHNHMFFGNKCPECAKNGIDEGVYTQYARIVGFYVPICTFSSVRKGEYSTRIFEPVEEDKG